MPNKRRRLGHHEPRVSETIRSTLVIALGVLGAVLVVASVGALAIEWNRSAEVRRCLSIDRFHVRPATPALPSDATREPSAWGSITFDTQQGFARWSLKEVYTISSERLRPTGFEIRGPFTPDSPETAPVAVQLGPGERHAVHEYRLAGQAHIELPLLHAIQNDPASYYFALFAGTGAQRREVGRSVLTALC